MPIELTAPALREIFPRAPQPVIDAFVADQDRLTKAGVNHTRQRLSFALSNVEHECGGFALKELTENTNYSPPRAAQIWPGRFPGGADQVRAKYGTGPGWQMRMFDDVYGSRMGNRPGTTDGSRYIGRGGPQITGRDGYREVGARAGLPLVDAPELACKAEHQPAILSGFVDWKNLNAKADVGDWRGYVKSWNGGHIGMADREAKLAGNDPVIERLKNVERIKPIAIGLPGAPPTPTPPKDVINAATKKERAARAGGVVSGAGGGTSKATTEQASKPILHSVVEWTLIGAGVAVFIVAAVLIARKTAAIRANWF